MAEIRVEPKKRSLAWLWLLLAALAVAAVVWYLNNDGVNQVETVPATSALEVETGAVRLAVVALPTLAALPVRPAAA